MQNRSPTTEEFIARSVAAHGDLYCYSKTEYKNASTPVIITCPKHGDFTQLPRNHIKYRSGCALCKKENARQQRIMTTAEFITKAVSVHGGLFSYENAVYNGWGNPCPDHVQSSR